ncbi:hypothetical protein ACA910_003498 [Epithemia clementina (nom. ined.)]
MDDHNNHNNHHNHNQIPRFSCAATATAPAILVAPMKTFAAAVTHSDTAAVVVERVAKSLLSLAVGYALARLKRRWLMQWSTTTTTTTTNAQKKNKNKPLPNAAAQPDTTNQDDDDDDDDDRRQHLYFYNLLLNGIIGSGVAIAILKSLNWHHGAGAGLQSVFCAGGLGALVFGIASRNVAEQVVGGLVLAATDAYDQGDRIRLPQCNVEGTVQRISLVGTDIQDNDYNIVQIPNSRILNQHIVNLSRVNRSRVQQTIRLRYQDLPNIPALVQGIPQAIAGLSPPLLAQTPIRAHLTNLLADHVEMVVTCHLHCRPGSAAFLHWRQQILLTIAQAVREAGADFCLPTSVLEPASSQRMMSMTNIVPSPNFNNNNNNSNNNNSNNNTAQPPPASPQQLDLQSGEIANAKTTAAAESINGAIHQRVGSSSTTKDDHHDKAKKSTETIPGLPWIVPKKKHYVKEESSHNAATNKNKRNNNKKDNKHDQAAAKHTETIPGLPWIVPKKKHQVKDPGLSFQTSTAAAASTLGSNNTATMTNTTTSINTEPNHHHHHNPSNKQETAVLSKNPEALLHDNINNHNDGDGDDHPF